MSPVMPPFWGHLWSHPRSCSVLRTEVPRVASGGRLPPGGTVGTLRGTLKGSVLVPAGTPFGTGSDRVRGRELRKAVRNILICMIWRSKIGFGWGPLWGVEGLLGLFRFEWNETSEANRYKE